MINKVADWVSSNRGLATILDNPIYTSLLLTFVIMLIFYFSPSTKATGRLRTSFYVFCSILAVTFIYHRRFRKRQEERTGASEIRSALASPISIPATERVAVIQPIYLSTPSMPSTSSMPSIPSTQTTSSTSFTPSSTSFAPQSMTFT
jgi:hypothetical protein